MRLFSVEQLAQRINGEVEIGRVRGNLLTGATLEDVAIRDSAGGPFLSADTVSLRYSIRSLFRKHLVFSDVRLVRPTVLFDKPPGRDWNVSRIFPGDTTEVRGDTVPGFGDWVRIEGLQVVDGTVRLRRPWESDSELNEVGGVIAPDAREHVVEVPGGYQALSSFHRVQADFPLLVLADPDSASRVVQVDSLSTYALPFRPPAARVENLSGRLTLTGDVLRFHDVLLELPASRVRLDGTYALDTPETVAMGLRGAPAALEDFRWLRPSLPDGGGRADVTLNQGDGRLRIVARDTDLRVEGGRIQGFARVETGEGGTRLDDSDLRFTSLDTRSVERLVGLDVPVDGVLGGHVQLAVAGEEVDVDGWATIEERGGATSRIEADGVVLNRPGGIVARSLALRFDPLRLTLARELRPDLPLRGSLVGRARLDGPLEGLFAVDADLVHRDSPTGRSHVLARGGLRVVGGVRADDLAVRFDPLQAELVRLFEPDLPLDGTFTGRARLDGPLTGRLAVDADVVHQGPEGRSHVLAEGALDLGDGVVPRGLEVRFDPLHTGVVRAFDPDFPLGGILTGRARLDGTFEGRFALDADVVHESPETGRSRVVAEGGLELRDGGVAHGLSLRFDPLQSAAARAFLPDFPVGGTIAGRATLTGPLAGMFTVDADLVHSSPDLGRSHVVADGGLRVDGDPAFRDLRFRADPMRVELLLGLGLVVPLDGTLVGTGTLDGATLGRLRGYGLDVTHRGSTGTSSVEGAVAVTLGDGIERFDVDLDARPLSLTTVGRFAPDAGLRGSVSGPIVARGTPGEATFDVALDVAEGGAIAARGTAGFGPTARYDVTATLASFDASAVTTRAPATALSGAVDVEGVGTEPATANAFIDASLVDSRLEGTPRFESTRVLARLDAGLVTFEEGRVRLASVMADVEGSFGLVEGRSGELRYTLVVDSLAGLSGMIPADTGVVVDRPMRRARAVGAARADSLRAVEDRIVESIATGRPPGPPPALDTVPPLPRDSVAGGLRAEGVLAGNIHRFDTRGQAVLRDLVLGGAVVGSGDVAYDVTDVGDPAMEGTVEADLVDVKVEGFAFDEVSARIDHRGFGEGEGRAEIEVVQEPEREYRLDAEYRLALDESEVRLHEMALRFDTTLWRSTGPGAVRWAGDGVEIETLELANDQGGRIFADGRLPDGAPGDLRLEVDSLQIAQVAALLQDTLQVRGLVSVDATITGTLAAPALEGSLAVDSLSRRGEALPDLRASFDYAARELTAAVEMVDSARAMLEGDVRIPVDLALRDREGPRLLDAPLTADLRVDSLPLQALPELTDQVRDLRGYASGTIEVRGTVSDPDMQGRLDVIVASAHIPEADITLRDGAGSVRLEGDLIHVDSLVASSDGGPVRAEGTIDVADLRRPELDLSVVASEARILNDERGNLRADVELSVEGPLRALRITGTAGIEGGEIRVPEPERYERVTRLDDPLLAGVLDTLGVPAELRPGPGLLADGELSIRVTIERDTWLRNADLDLEIYTPPGEAPLRVTNNPETGDLVLEGTVNSDRGRYTFAGRELELTSGSVTFLGSQTPDPLLQLNASHEVPRRGREALVILVNVGGRLSEPRLTLSSNSEPPLPESDLLSYLAFGRDASSLFASEGSGIMGDALGGLGVLAEQQLAGLAVGTLTDAFFTSIEREGLRAGLDVFRARPAPLYDEINYAGYFENLLRGMELEGGEYIGDRLFVAAKVRPASARRPGLRAEYRTPGGFSWITRWEPRFLPSLPALGLEEIDTAHVFGSFLMWSWRY
ncbi:MAG: translocation/assembly module TamB [Gemmatimonadetes bacterium]|nr:translocation/assembly module TamB [Gemmatimonadota bacterium]